jgi:hypothetical protein
MFDKIKKGIRSIADTFNKWKQTSLPQPKSPNPKSPDTSRYIYITQGLNRKERRAFDKRHRQGRITQLEKLMRRITPKNIPATHGVLKQNSERLRQGAPILVLSNG